MALPRSSPLINPLLHSLRGFCGLCLHSIADPVCGSYRRPFLRALTLVVIVPLLGLLQAIHWLGFLLDEILFRRYQRTEIKEPVFVIGPPRSGTTHLHRVLAADAERFTTFSTWELFLAPSIVEKKLIRVLARLDRRLGAPMNRLLGRVERGLLQGFDSTHRSALSEPEEDFYLLLTTFSCTGLILVFPRWDALWKLAAPDDPASVAAASRALDFYHRCLRKHLYLAPPGTRLLSKNASFAAWLELLDRRLPDARYIVPHRSPAATVPSMLSCADTTRRMFAAETSDGDFHRRLTDLMRSHYGTLARVLPELPAQRVFHVSQQDLRHRLAELIEQLYRHFGWTLSPAYRTILESSDQRSRTFRSQHRYTAADFGLSEEELEQSFPDFSRGKDSPTG